MKKSLDALHKELYTKVDNNVTLDIDESFYDKIIVALAVGGRGQRLESVTGGTMNKNVLKVGEETLVERVIKMYRDAGIKKFVALVYTNADSIFDVLKDGSHLGVNITYSTDPEKPVGRGGAILNALMNKSIPEDHFLIVHNPDDQIVDSENFVKDCLMAHLTGERSGHSATAIVTTATPYAFTGMKIREGSVVEIDMYPMVPIPTHIGVTIFNPDVYSCFKELFNLKEKVDFEKILFPYLSERGKLYSHGIAPDCWIPVNDPKGYESLRSRLKK